jgi:hypothetical protein
MANYPTSVPSFTNKSAGQTIASAHINSIQDEVVAIGSGLLQGTAPLASSNSTVANLSVSGASTLATLGVTGNSSFGGAFVRKGVIDVTLSSGDNHNLNPTGISSAYALRLTGSASGSTLTGITGGAVGRELLLIRASTAIIGLKNDAGSSAGVRIQMASNSDTTFQYARLWYDDASARWLLVSREG